MAPRPLLVIDDDVAVVEIITRALADDGYVVEAATTAPAARRLLETHGRAGFRLVLCDALSSPTDLFAWLDQVRTLTAAPVVIASGYPATAFAGWAERGYAAVLAKPFDLGELTALVVGLCGPPQQERDPAAP